MFWHIHNHQTMTAGEKTMQGMGECFL